MQGEITSEERQWLFGWLQRAWKTAPHTSWQSDTYGDRIDPEDLRRCYMEDALRDYDAIWQAVVQWSETERWPRLKRPTAFFLRERLLTAQERSGMLDLPIGTRFQRSSLPQARATEIVHWFIVDDWQHRGAAEWTETQLSERSERETFQRANFPEDYDDL